MSETGSGEVIYSELQNKISRAQEELKEMNENVLGPLYLQLGDLRDDLTKAEKQGQAAIELVEKKITANMKLMMEEEKKKDALQAKIESWEKEDKKGTDKLVKFGIAKRRIRN